jgi:hypothetical protein
LLYRTSILSLTGHANRYSVEGCPKRPQQLQAYTQRKLFRKPSEAPGVGERSEQYYAARIEQRRTVQNFVTCVDSGAFSPLKAIENIAFSEELADNEKVQRIQGVLRAHTPQRDAAFEQMTAIKTQIQREAEDADYYEVLAKQSRKLHNRLARSEAERLHPRDSQTPYLLWR